MDESGRLQSVVGTLKPQTILRNAMEFIVNKGD
jgi:hypothetical protein